MAGHAHKKTSQHTHMLLHGICWCTAGCTGGELTDKEKDGGNVLIDKEKRSNVCSEEYNADLNERLIRKYGYLANVTTKTSSESEKDK